jgi:hypothetical protein
MGKRKQREGNRGQKEREDRKVAMAMPRLIQKWAL